MKQKIMAMVLGGLMILGTLTPMTTKASTFSYTPINGPSAEEDTFKFDKNFVIPNGVEVPAATFTYTVAPGTAIDPNPDMPGTDTVRVLAGVGTPIIADVVYTANEQASADMTITEGAENYTATKKATVDFSDCEFKEPGVYRYIVTESGTNQGVTNDPIPTRTLDVYVENVAGTTTVIVGYEHTVNGEIVPITVEEYEALDEAEKANCVPVESVEDTHVLEVSGFVFYEGTMTTAPSATDTTAEGKSEGYTNIYTTANLEFGKEVTGNFGSKDTYFPFTVTLGNLTAGTTLNVILDDADAVPHDSEGNAYMGNTPAANPSTITVGSDGTVTQVFWIHDGQYIVIKGLPEGTTYSVTENSYDYEQTSGIVASLNDEGVAHTDPTSGTFESRMVSTPSKINWNGMLFDTVDEAYNAWAMETFGDIPEFDLSWALENGFSYEITEGTIQMGLFDYLTGYTNNKDVVTPTGVSQALTTFAPIIVIGFIAIGGIVFFARKKKVTE